MFTGLIETTGRIERSDGTAAGRLLRVRTPMASELGPGDSIAVSGVCLTVTSHDETGFTADVSRETLAVTSLGVAEDGRIVNLERPLRADARLGGHFVLGHVDGTGTIRALRPDGNGHWLEIAMPPSMVPYLISKGSVAVDGISLTVAALSTDSFGVQIVPFTFVHTSLHDARVGDVVNLEADVLGKYVARLLNVGAAAAAVVDPLSESHSR